MPEDALLRVKAPPAMRQTLLRSNLGLAYTSTKCAVESQDTSMNYRMDTIRRKLNKIQMEKLYSMNIDLWWPTMNTRINLEMMGSSSIPIPRKLVAKVKKT
jgi:hypothetical protein